jgi:hypothetical protein
MIKCTVLRKSGAIGILASATDPAASALLDFGPSAGAVDMKLGFRPRPFPPNSSAPERASKEPTLASRVLGRNRGTVASFYRLAPVRSLSEAGGRLYPKLRDRDRKSTSRLRLMGGTRVLTERQLVYAAVALSATAFSITVYKLYVFAQFDARSAVLVSLVYSACTFAIWRMQFAVIRPNGGLFSYVPVLTIILHAEHSDVVRGLLAALISELVLVLLIVRFLPRKPRALERKGRQTTTDLM